jgi:predicted nucleotidyltransferase
VEPHHGSSIANLVAAFEADESVLALLLTGSIAHGFAAPDSDIDVTFVVSADEYTERTTDRRLTYNNRSLCTYPGYIDGKYADLGFLRLVAERGSDPARYAFKDCRVLFSRVPGLDELLDDFVRFPVAQKRDRVDRFAAQLLAWRWYYTEAIRQENRYLRYLAIQKVVLFSCRIVLTDNELLYPYHKWLLRVVGGAPRKPAGFMEAVGTVLSNDTRAAVEGLCRSVFDFADVDVAAADAAWPTTFMRDTELAWTEHEAPIDDA